MHTLTKRKEVVHLCCFEKVIGVSALTFGAGVLLCTFLPPIALVCVQAAVIVGAGVVIFVK